MNLFDLQCRTCKGELEAVEGATRVAKCIFCGRKQSIPILTDERRANQFKRAEQLRINNDYDKAIAVYEKLIEEDPTDPEAYWSMVLCRYGIEYVNDPATGERKPTVNRTQYTSILADEDYRSAIKLSNKDQKVLYEAEAREINDIQKGILEIASKEDPFDIFICYKETDEKGKRTKDSILAQELYHELERDGYKVFFARVTLDDKLGSAYEPYIFSALNSAKVMVVLGTCPEYFNAVWVRNEWSRFLGLIKNGEKKMLIPAYKDMDAYDLPDEFAHLQALNMDKLGFMADLVMGIEKMLAFYRKDEKKAEPKPEPKPEPIPQPKTQSVPQSSRVVIEPTKSTAPAQAPEKKNKTALVAVVAVLVVAAIILSAIVISDISKNPTVDPEETNKPSGGVNNGDIFEILTDKEPEKETEKKPGYSFVVIPSETEPEEDKDENMNGIPDKDENGEEAPSGDLNNPETPENPEDPDQNEDSAYDYLIFTLSTDKTYYSVTGGDYPHPSRVVIPEYYNDLPVTAIDSNAFSYWEELESVSLPSTIRTIGNSAFAYCTKLTEITLPSSLERIEANAFVNCSALEEITIPTRLKYCGYTSFERCGSLKTVYVNDLAAWFKIRFEDASANPASIAGGIIVDGVKLEELVVPEGVSSIGAYALYGFTNLKSLKIHKGVTELGECALYNLHLTSLTIPAGLMSWVDTTSVQKMELVGSTPIESNAFSNCNSLTELIISGDLTSIATYAFEGCNSLRYITFHGSRSDWNALSNVEGNGVLRKVMISCDTEDIDFGYETCVDEQGVIYALGSTKKYYFVYGFNEGYTTNVTILSELNGLPVTYIGDQAFWGKKNLVRIVIPEGITSIGVAAFSGCLKLAEVDLPSTLTEMSDYAFDGCNSISNVIFQGPEDFWYNVHVGTGNGCLTEAKREYGGHCPHKETYKGSNCDVICEYCRVTVATAQHAEGYIDTYDNCNKKCKDCGYVLAEAQHGGETYIDEYDNCNKKCSDCGAVLEEKQHDAGSIDIEDRCNKKCTHCGTVLAEEQHQNVTTTVNSTGLKTTGCLDCGTVLETTESNIRIDDYVTSFETGAAYFGVLAHHNLEKLVYLDGKVDPEKPYYLSETDDASMAALVYFEQAPEGNYYMYFLSNTTKTYVNVAYDGTHYSIVLETTPTSTWYYDDYYGCPITVSSENDQMFLGTSNEGVYENVCIKRIEEGIEFFKVQFVKVDVELSIYVNSDGVEYVLSEDGSYHVTGLVAGADNQISILEEINGIAVTKIENYAFDNCTELISVSIPSSVISIGDNAFENCSSLETVNLTDSVETIGYGAFNNCTNLTNVYFDGTASQWEKVEIGSENEHLLVLHIICLQEELESGK